MSKNSNIIEVQGVRLNDKAIEVLRQWQEYSSDEDCIGAGHYTTLKKLSKYLLWSSRAINQVGYDPNTVLDMLLELDCAMEDIMALSKVGPEKQEEMS